MNPGDAHRPEELVPRLVLDTNACLDWLVFRDPAAQGFVRALEQGQVALLACASMREELSHMLRHASLARWQVDADAALALYDRHACFKPEPQAGASQRLACSDPDDQVFIDLAVTQSANWLLTHDKALLKLARRARALGVQVIRPKDWAGPAFSPATAPAAPARAPQPSPPRAQPPPSGRSAEPRRR